MNVPSLNQAIGHVDQAAAARLRRYRAAHPGMPCPSVRFALDDANRTIDACEAGQMTEPEAVRSLDAIAAALGDEQSEMKSGTMTPSTAPSDAQSETQ